MWSTTIKIPVLDYDVQPQFLTIHPGNNLNGYNMHYSLGVSNILVTNHTTRTGPVVIFWGAFMIAGVICVVVYEIIGQRGDANYCWRQ
jgi:hypothetical protein